ncbi:MAG: hypothetical protein AB8B62_11325 [Roseobacter sp.]
MPGHFISIEDILATKWPEEYLQRPLDAFLQAVQLSPFDVDVDPALGLSIETLIIFGERATLGVVGVDLIRLGFGGSDTPVSLFARAYPEQHVRVGPLPLSILITHDALIPMRRVLSQNGTSRYEDDATRDHVSAEFAGAEVSISSNTGLTVHNTIIASVDPFMIEGTGLVLALEGASLILRDADWHAGLGQIGFDDSFRGVYADSASLYWLPQMRILGEEIPGLRIDLNNLGIGNQGLSFDLQLSWQVVFDDQGVFDPDRTEILGSIFDKAWQVALQHASGTVRTNVPEAFEVHGFIKIPAFATVFGCTFGLRYSSDPETPDDSYATHFQLRKASESVVTLAIPGGALTLSSFQAGGLLNQSGFTLSGLASFAVSLNDLALTVNDAGFSFVHENMHDAFSFSLGDIQLGNFTQLRDAKAKISGQTSETGDFMLEEFMIAGACRWSDLSTLIPSDLQVLSLEGSASLRAEVRWVRATDDPAGPTKVVIELFSGVSHLDGLWDFIPPDLRPTVLSAESFFRVTYADSSALSDATRDSTKIDIALSAKLKLRLPEALTTLDIPGMDLIDLQAGDDGVVSAEFKIDIATGDTGDASASAGLVLEDLIAMDLRLPGGLSADPFIATRFFRLEIAANVGDETSTFGGTLALAGDFIFRPMVPSNIPFAPRMAGLLRSVGLDEVLGMASARLTFRDDDFELTLKGTFEEASLSLDIFDMIAALAQSGAQGGDIDIDAEFEVGFSLSGFTMSLVRDSTGNPEDPFSFSFDLDLAIDMTGLPTLNARIRLSDDEFALGLTDLSIPLAMPTYPISVSDLDLLEGPDALWSHAQLDTLIDSEIDPRIAQLEDIQHSDVNPVTLSAAEREKASAQLRKLMLQLLMQVHARVGTQGAPVFQSLVHADTLIHETLLGVLHFDSQLQLTFPDIKISIPFDNPDGIAISGEGKIEGFADDDPFKPLEDYSLTLGLSTQYIFARLSGGTPVPIPSFGSPYDDGSLTIDDISIAYGYSKNSLAFGFKGALVWPSQLIEDADLSKTLGAGIRLPRYNKIAFQLDTIVLTVGKVTLVIPLPQFDIDLSTPGAPDYIWDGNRRRPHWDGLEVIAKDALHVDFKRLALSPFFGFLLAPNIKFDGDIEVGNDSNGATLIIDDLHLFSGIVAGSTAIIPIPYILDPTAPFFRTLTANLRVAGFEVNFTLERPFPNPSPVAVFEAFGLISNPAMEIDADGALANTFFIRLDNAYVQLPEYVTQMFPATASMVDKRYGFTLNLGTLINMAQQIAGPVSSVLEALEELNAPDLAVTTALLQEASAMVDPATLISLLPPELRKFRAGGHVGGFEASACIVLATEAEARASFDSISGLTPPLIEAQVPKPPTVQAETRAGAAAALRTMLGEAVPNTAISGPVDTLAGQRLVNNNEALDLFKGIEFRQFTAQDLTRIPVEEMGAGTSTSGAYFGARLRVAGSQRIRFFGKLLENGAFAMISTAQIKPLELRIFGLPLALPFAGAGRLLLTGGQKRTGPWGRIEAEGTILWEPIRGVLSVTAGGAARPARLALFSDGRFAIDTPAKLDLFSGAATITGRGQISHERFAFSGALNYTPQADGAPRLIAMQLTGSGVVNPVAQSQSGTTKNPSFSFDGAGDLTLIGRQIANLRVHVNDHRATFDVNFHKPAVSTPDDPIPLLGACDITLSGKGSINLRRKVRPEFDVTGETRLSLFGATLTGAGGVRAQPLPAGTAASDRFEAWAKGVLRWQGQDWLGGHVSVGSKGLRMGGQCNFGLKITPDNIPGTGINLAHLFVNISLNGEFGLDPSMNKHWFRFTGDWNLGAGLPDTGNLANRQIVPLASNTFTFESTGGDFLGLFDIAGFQFLPFDSLSFTAPDIKIRPTATAKTLLRAGRLDDGSGASATELWTPVGWIGMRSDSLFPTLGAQQMKGNPHKVFSAYQAEVDWQTVTLSPSAWADLSLGLSLRKDAARGEYPMRLELRSGDLPPITIPLAP